MKFFISKLYIILITTVASTSAYAGFDFNQQPSGQVNVTGSISNPLEVVMPMERVNRTVPHLPPVSILKEEKTEPKAVLHVFLKGNNETSDEAYAAALVSTSIIDKNYKHINVSTWKANEGESLKDVIDRWSKRADTGLVWGLAERKIVLESVSYFGSYEDALMHLFDRGMQGTVEGQLSYNDVEDEQEVMEPIATSMKSKVSYVSIEELNQLNSSERNSVEKKWKINKQNSLNKLLSEWQDAGEYQLIWDYPYDMKVERDLFVYGTVEEALNLLLDGYKSMNTRPVGNMYKDTESGLVYLHIKEEK